MATSESKPDSPECSSEADYTQENMDVSSDDIRLIDNPSNTITKMECDSSSEIDPEKALAFKTEGNEAFKKKDYDTALELYTKSLHFNPNHAPTLSNRSAVYFHLRDYNKAQDDANQAIRVEETFVKSYFRLAKCHVATGNVVQARVMFDKALALEPSNQCTINEINNCVNLISFQDRYEKAFFKSDFREAIYYIVQMTSNGVDCPFIYSKQAEALCLSGNLDGSTILCNDYLRRFSNNSDLIFVKALIEYYRDNLERAKTLFTIVLKSDPDHSKSLKTFKTLKLIHRRKEEGNKAVKERQYEVAKKCYDDALTIDPFNRICNSKLLCNRALCKEKLGDYEGGIEDCTEAIKLDESYVRAFQRRAKLFQDTNQHNEAVAGYETVMRLEPSQNSKANLTEAKRLQKIAKRKDYYKILNLNRIATDDEIKRGYRKQAVLHHPDKHANDTEEQRQEEERLFKEASEAYSVLSDPKKKVRYDRGEDLEDFATDFDPSQIFQSFFTMGGMPAGMGGQTGHPGFTFSYGGGGGDRGFPGFF